MTRLFHARNDGSRASGGGRAGRRRPPRRDRAGSRHPRRSRRRCAWPACRGGPTSARRGSRACRPRPGTCRRVAPDRRCGPRRPASASGGCRSSRSCDRSSASLHRPGSRSATVAGSPPRAGVPRSGSTRSALMSATPSIDGLLHALAHVAPATGCRVGRARRGRAGAATAPGPRTDRPRPRPARGGRHRPTRRHRRRWRPARSA